MALENFSFMPFIVTMKTNFCDENHEKISFHFTSIVFGHKTRVTVPVVETATAANRFKIFLVEKIGLQSLIFLLWFAGNGTSQRCSCFHVDHPDLNSIKV